MISPDPTVEGQVSRTGDRHRRAAQARASARSSWRRREPVKTVLLQNIANAITDNHPEVLPARPAHRRTSGRSDRHAAQR